MRRTPFLFVAGLASLVSAGCSLSSREQWAEINQHGLLPVLMDDHENRSGNPPARDAVRVQAVATPVVVKTPTASPVPGRDGYAFTPYTKPLRVVDIRGFQPGEEVRCPFTGRPFLVPGSRIDAPVVAVHRPLPPATEVVSNAPGIPFPDAPFPTLEVPVLPSPSGTEPPAAHAAPFNAAEAADSLHPSAPGEKTRPQIPYGTRVAGRPGFVYSPYAEKTQLVDVATTAPGVVVRCPYTDKLFRVPELAGEELPPVAQPAGGLQPPAETPAPSPLPVPAPDPATPPAPDPVQPNSPVADPAPAPEADAPPQP
jgi:hypothetical protein